MKEVLYTLEKEKYSLHIISSNTENTIKEVYRKIIWIYLKVFILQEIFLENTTV